MQHDERIDVLRLKRVGCKFDLTAGATGSVKVVTVPKNGLGIKSLGRLDYLTRYCHYVVHYVNRNVIMTTDTKSIREQKKAKKEPKLTNKTNNKNKKK